ncbi:MAG: endonuclease/exonuclease/phosphatase family protein [Myxococcota bacterium]
MKACSLSTLALLLPPLACSGPKDPPADPSFELRVATYNAALAPAFAPLVAERGEPVITALTQQASSLDLLCVQEFWLEDHWTALRDSAASQLPHAVRKPPRPGSGNCSEEELGKLVGCLQSSCSEHKDAELVSCATTNCAEAVVSLNPGCLGCVMNHVAGDLTACVGEPQPSDPAIFGGSFDVGLLSRYPILASDIKELTSYFVRVAALYAKLDVPGAGPVHAFCTHLGSPLDIVPYGGAYGSWHDEQRQQILELLGFIRQKTHGSGRVLVLGDMNTGPAHASIHGEWQDNYIALTSNGLQNPYLAQGDADCTWCPSNTYHPDAEPTLIDHILQSGFDGASTIGARLFVDPVQLTLTEGSVAAHLSDHYGLQSVIRSGTP